MNLAMIKCDKIFYDLYLSRIIALIVVFPASVNFEMGICIVVLMFLAIHLGFAAICEIALPRITKSSM